MIQPLFNGMLAVLMAKFIINDLPHSAGLLADHRDTDEPTPGQLRYIASLCQRLKITVTYEERVKSFGEAGRLIRELEAEVEHRKKLKGSSSNPAQLGTCYSDAWRYLIRQGEGYLIHGSVQLTEEGARVKHAWVELPTGYVWEPQTGQHFTREDFQIFSPIEEHRYTAVEAAIMAARASSLGPWTDEDRAKYMEGRTATNPKDWVAGVAEQEPSTIYPWLYEKFGGKKLQDAPWQERQRIAQEISTLLGQEYNIPSEANEYGVVEIPADYFKDNRDHVYDALDEITGIRHTRPWRK